MTKSDPDKPKGTTLHFVDSTPLYEAAITSHQKTKAEAWRKRVAAQKRFVKKLVGVEFFDMCFYDEVTDMWTICGHQFDCFTIGTYSPCLSYGVGDLRSYIYTLADLGAHLQKQNSPSMLEAVAAVADEMKKPGKVALNRLSSSGPRSWWHRIRG